MLIDEIKAELKAHKIEEQKCGYCNVDPKSPKILADLKPLLECNNCKVDIFCRGQWTGHGWNALAAAYQFYVAHPKCEAVFSFDELLKALFPEEKKEGER
jgi:hypothetical protein